MEDKQADNEPMEETQPWVEGDQGEQFQNGHDSSQSFPTDLSATSNVEQQNATP